MLMKYFRFLFGESGKCVLQFSEITDTKTDEVFTSLYLRGITEHVHQEETDHKLFLFPKRIHLMVIGETNAFTKQAVKELLSDTRVDTMIYASGADVWETEALPGVEKVICLDTEKTEQTTGNAAVQTYGSSCELEKAGWRFTVLACGEGKAALFHEPAADAGQNPYSDCVMSVKTVCEGKRCLYQEKPDGYGCALGCALHQDSDICRYQRPGNGLPYVTGSVLLPEITDQAAMDRLMGVLQEKLSGVRFFGLPEQAGSSIVQKIVAIQKSEPEEASAPEAAQGRPTCKRYFIGAASELKDATIASISRGEPDHIPVILGNGQSICCSGFLKYSPE